MAVVTDETAAVIQTLLELDDAGFSELVDQDLRGTRQRQPANQVLHDALRSSEIIDRFWAHLSAINQKVEGDLAFRKAEVDLAKAEVEALRSDRAPAHIIERKEQIAKTVELDYMRWRPNVVRFKGGLEATLNTVRVRRDDLLRDKIPPDLIDRLQRRIADLESAIRNHRSSVEPSEATPDDEALWAVVSNQQ